MLAGILTARRPAVLDADALTGFAAAPAALFAALRAARAGGPAVIGHYHSHPSGQATPSATDADAAAADGILRAASSVYATPPWGGVVQDDFVNATVLVDDPARDAALAAAGIREIRAAGTTLDPTRPADASKVVRQGIYRYSRNPIYLGDALLLAGYAIHRRDLLAILPVAGFVGVIDTFQVSAEEEALRDRFGFTGHLDYYTAEDLATILAGNAVKLGIASEPAGIAEIAGRSRGTPRIANRLLRRVRDWAQVHGQHVVSAEAAREALALFDVDLLGLDRLDRAVLEALCHRFDGGPVGLTTLAVAVGEEADTVETVAEPYLVREGFIVRTPRGRAATTAAWEHLGTRPPADPAGRFGHQPPLT